MPNADARVAVPAGERQYHIGLGPGEVADYILLPGDQDRVERIASHFDSIERTHRHREFASATGEYRGLRVTALSTGIGTDNVEIVLAEVLAIADRPDVHPDRLVRRAPGRDRARATSSSRPAASASRRPPAGSSTRAIPRSRTTSASSPSRRPQSRLGHRHHMGITATAPGFYGAQGRPIPQLPIRYPDLAEEMTRQGILNFEMEASALLVLAGLGGCRAGVVCAVYANRRTGEFVVGDSKDEGGGRRGGDGAREPRGPRGDRPPEGQGRGGALAPVSLVPGTERQDPSDSADRRGVLP